MEEIKETTTEKKSKWRKLEAWGLLSVAIFWLAIYLAFVIFMALGAKRVGKPEMAPTSEISTVHVTRC